MADLTLEKRIGLYRLLRLNRALEKRLVLLYRQGRIVGGLYRSLGQEATSVGSAFALEPVPGGESPSRVLTSLSS